MPEVIEPLRRPTPNSPATPIHSPAPCQLRGAWTMPSCGLKTEYSPSPAVKRPNKRIIGRSGARNTSEAPRITPGSPAARMMRLSRQAKPPSRPWRKRAPTPRKTLATLWVARATPKLRPRKIRMGNWIRPAPPPERAEKKLATREAANRTQVSMPDRVIASTTPSSA